MKKNYLLLVLILALAVFLRLYSLSSTPPALTWDEASIAYDAYSILQDGTDQWGEFYPLVFKSFGENKYPLHIYATALSIKAFGLNDFATRLPSAILGVINIFILYLLVKRLFHNNITSLFSALFLAISPWHIQFSRMNWETNIVLMFFFSGLLFFLNSFKKKKYFLFIAFVLWGISLYTYNAAKVFIPIFLITISIIYYKELLSQKIYALLALVIFACFLALGFLAPQLSGSVRFKQVTIDKDQVLESTAYKLTQNKYVGAGELVIEQYFSHFSPKFLFISGDQNPRHSIQSIGELYLFELLLIPLGVYFLIKKKTKITLLLLTWVLLAPIPAAIVKEAPHASRAMFMLGVMQIISALGLTFLLTKIKFKKIAFSATFFAVLIFLGYFMYSYFIIYPKLFADEYQYGYKRIYQDYQKDFKSFDQIIVTDRYAQPYIFALYYLGIDPQDFRDSVIYEPPEIWGFSTVKSFSGMVDGKKMPFLFTKIDEAILPHGKLLVFTSTEDKLKNAEPKDAIKNLKGDEVIYVYEYNK